MLEVMNESTRKKTPPFKTPAVDECMIMIMQMIRDGELSSSERVGEASLAMVLGVGLAAVRTALNRLALVGVIDRVPRSGSFVRKFSIKDFSQITDVRCAMECLSIRLATLAASEEELADLCCMAAVVDAEVVSPALELSEGNVRTFQSDRDFHLKIAHLSKNTWLFPILENQHLLERCLLIGSQLGRLPAEQMLQIPNHFEIVEAMRSRDARVAEEMMRKHILMHKEIRVRALLGDFL